jgi:small conductance mechanosensitive channel
MKKAFDEKNIEIPFLHITLYPGEDKTGSAPPLRVVTGEQ